MTGVANTARRRGVPLGVLVPLALGLGLFVPSIARAEAPGARWSLHALAEPTSLNAADVQDNAWELTVSATAGQYKLHPGFINETTAAIAWDAPASKVQEALEALPEIGEHNVAVSGGPGDASGSTPYRIEWVGALSGGNIGFLNVTEAELSGTAVTRQIAVNRALDRIAVSVVNVGSRPSEGEMTITDQLPSGLTLAGEPKVEEPSGHAVPGECAAREPKCTFPHSVQPGREVVMFIPVAMTSPTLTGSIVNSATASGGGGGQASASTAIAVNLSSTPFGVNRFAFEAVGVGGLPDLQAGDHPYGVTTTIDFNSRLEAHGTPAIVQDVKDVAVELPLGFAGDPLAAPQCPEVDMTDPEGILDTESWRTACPAASEVGTIGLVYGGGRRGNHRTYNPLPDL